MEFNCECQNEGNNGGIVMYNYGFDHRELGEQFLVLKKTIHLRLFLMTLTVTTAEWYIELPSNFYANFGSLDMEFFMHF